MARRRHAALAGVTAWDAILDRIADAVAMLGPGGFLRLCIDGVDGVGKTSFADALAPRIAARGRPVLRASADSFHQPRALRYARGRESPEGFYRDSYDLGALRRLLLDPLAPDGTGRHRLAVFDHRADAPLDTAEALAPTGAVLVLDGMFLHRPELAGCFEATVFLDAPFGVTIPRGAARGPGHGSPDPEAPSNRRYVEGQRLYLAQASPAARASVVIDAADLAAPVLRAWRLSPQA